MIITSMHDIYLSSYPQVIVRNEFRAFIIMMSLMIQIAIQHSQTYRWQAYKERNPLPQQLGLFCKVCTYKYYCYIMSINNSNLKIYFLLILKEI